MSAERRSKTTGKSPRLRLFVALDLPDMVVDAIIAWQEEAFSASPGLRLLPRQSLHATLAFLGYQAEKDVDRIAKASFAEPPDPFELRPKGVVPVPKRQPRLYALDLEDSGGALVHWQAGLSERLERARFYEPEKRPFWPHVTIARFKTRSRKRAPMPVQGAPPELPDRLREAFQADRITLYRSTLSPRGAVYEPIASLNLEGGQPPES